MKTGLGCSLRRHLLDLEMGDMFGVVGRSTAGRGNEAITDIVDAREEIPVAAEGTTSGIINHADRTQGHAPAFAWAISRGGGFVALIGALARIDQLHSGRGAVGTGSDRDGVDIRELARIGLDRCQ